MKLTNFLFVFVLSAIAVFALMELLFVLSSHRKLSNQRDLIAPEAESINKENASIKEDISYFTDPQNLEKELRGEFNYKKPGEKMIIIVPQQSQ